MEDFRGRKLIRPRAYFGDGKVHRLDDRRSIFDLRRNLRTFSPEKPRGAMNESQAPYRLPARSASRNPCSLIAVTAATISGLRWQEGRPRHGGCQHRRTSSLSHFESTRLTPAGTRSRPGARGFRTAYAGPCQHGFTPGRPVQAGSDSWQNWARGRCR